ncbi:MAG: hypothetical protein M1828_001044 [Chrysothrix sp. TS-e1954]|nr:MAG: hypothetical protein M1828_001044 [Chrysothrix sp. TS-e1954]
MPTARDCEDCAILMKSLNLVTCSCGRESEHQSLTVRATAEWEVQEVNGHRLAFKDGFLRLQYRVRWMGWDLKEDSWLSESDLDLCSELVFEYQMKRNFEDYGSGSSCDEDESSSADSEDVWSPTESEDDRVLSDTESDDVL